MEFKKEGDEEHLHLSLEKQLLLLLSDDNQSPPDPRSRVSKDPVFHGSCGCTSSIYSEHRVQKNKCAKVEMGDHVKKVLKQKNGSGTGVFIPQKGLSSRKKMKQPGSW